MENRPNWARRSATCLLIAAIGTALQSSGAGNTAAVQLSAIDIGLHGGGFVDSLKTIKPIDTAVEPIAAIRSDILHALGTPGVGARNENGAVAADFREIELQQIHFSHDSAALTPGAQRQALAAVDRFANENAKRIKLLGFSDTRGPASYNRKLAERRANKVARLLVDAGIPRDKIDIVANGENNLPEPTANEVDEPLNRCVGIVAIH